MSSYLTMDKVAKINGVKFKFINGVIVITPNDGFDRVEISHSWFEGHDEVSFDYTDPAVHMI